MANHGDFIPRPKVDATGYGALVHGVIAADSYDPATLGLTDDDVAGLGDLVSANQDLLAEIDTLKAALMGKTKALSGPNGSHRQMVAKLRNIGNKARISNASNAELALIGVRRKKTNPTLRSAPADAPGITLDHLAPGVIYFRLHDNGNAGPLARAENATGAQVAVVDGTTTLTAGEADKVPQVFASRTMGQLDSTTMPAQVRLYARWQTQRGLVSPWSAPLTVTVA